MRWGETDDKYVDTFRRLFKLSAQHFHSLLRDMAFLQTIETRSKHIVSETNKYISIHLVQNGNLAFVRVPQDRTYAGWSLPYHLHHFLQFWSKVRVCRGESIYWQSGPSKWHSNSDIKWRIVGDFPRIGRCGSAWTGWESYVHNVIDPLSSLLSVNYLHP